MSNGFVEFRQGLPFYKMVSAFMVSLGSCPAIFNKNNPMKLESGQYITLQGILVDGRHIYPHEIYTQAQQGNISQASFIKSCCGMLANTAYESVKDKNDHSPEFEFFRHVRNASSHGNKFSFSAREPIRPAEWRTAKINHHNKGEANSLYERECFGTYIGVSDLIDLLKDIEAKISI